MIASALDREDPPPRRSRRRRRCHRTATRRGPRRPRLDGRVRPHRCRARRRPPAAARSCHRAHRAERQWEVNPVAGRGPAAQGPDRQCDRGGPDRGCRARRRSRPVALRLRPPRHPARAEPQRTGRTQRARRRRFRPAPLPGPDPGSGPGRRPDGRARADRHEPHRVRRPRVESLSGGQLQRVWFACCLAQRHRRTPARRAHHLSRPALPGGDPRPGPRSRRHPRRHRRGRAPRSGPGRRRGRPGRPPLVRADRRRGHARRGVRPRAAHRRVRHPYRRRTRLPTGIPRTRAVGRHHLRTERP